MILSLKNITKLFGTDEVLKDISFNVGEREKIAIVGVNGAGKTTLFKIITEQLLKDGGDIILSKGVSIGYLPQISEMESKNNVYDEMLSVFAYLIQLEQDIRQLEHEMSLIKDENRQKKENEQLMLKYSRLLEEFEAKKGYEYKSRVRGVVRGLGFSDEESMQIVSTLSGGEKTRVALGKLLLTQPNLLLLDEPTNHLDINAIEWLEDFLKNYSKSVLIISHDRYFLNRVITKVIEIENGSSVVYDGDYSFFASKKEIDRQVALKHYLNQQKEIKRQEDIIKKLRSFNREKSIKRAESREKLLSKLERVEKPNELPEKMRISLTPKKESGNDVFSVICLSKYFEDEMLFKNISFDIKKGEKIALIGPNGVGKTTLLRIMLNRLSYNSGEIKKGVGVTIGYYDQEHQNLEEDNTLFDELKNAYPNLTDLEVRNALAAFMFTEDDVFKQIKTLSGGERGRVSLAKIMLSNANFLILDEPTNHLDMYSKEILEETIRNYTGTVFYVSHDRYFINNTAEKVLELRKDGVSKFLGNYDYYVEKKAENKQLSIETNAELPTGKNDYKQKKDDQSEKRRIKNLILKTEKNIKEAEARLSELDNLLLKEEICTNHLELEKIYNEKEAVENKLYELYELLEKTSN